VTGYAGAPGDPALQILDLGKSGGEWADQLVNAPATLSVPASDIGQVFGIAMDDATPANIYATATSAYGLRIEGSGKDAKWAPDQFGVAKKGGPGSIWKIDGTTGEVSLFANVALNGTPNSGPGLGNIAFDPVSQQLFVSDLDTGMIHRFGLDGNVRGTFDHGVTARPTTGLKPLPFDAKNRLDITSSKFKPDDPKSWAFAAPGRAVWGLAVDGGRLYYAVAEGPQIWSIAIGLQGEFGPDPRLELDLPAGFSPNPISDITFTADRKMIVAQRGGHRGGKQNDHHRGGDNAVIVFSLELPDDKETPSAWAPEPDIVPVGKEKPFRQAAGGVSVGHGYNEDGTLNLAACKSSLWVTGDGLTTEGAEAIDGLQGQRATGFSKTPEAPQNIAFIKVFDKKGPDAPKGGVGDIEIYTDCAGKPLAELPAYEAPTCPGDPRCPAPYEPPEVGPDPGTRPKYKGPDLAVVKIAQGQRCDKGQPCSFQVLVRNVGSEPYYGPVTFEDTNANNDSLQSYGPTPPWSCAAGDFIAAFCRHPDTYIAPGDGISVDLTFTIPQDWAQPTYRNCAKLSWPAWQGFGDANPRNDEGCDYAPICQPGTPGCGPDLMIEQVSSGLCETFGFCRLITRITNVGAEDYTGPLAFNVVEFTPDLVLQNYARAAEWSCGASGAANYGCFSQPVTLSPGQSRQVYLTLVLPDDYGSERARQCVQINRLPGGSDANETNNYACQEFRVCREGSDCPPDLSVSFRGFCDRDQTPDCTIAAIIRNVGAQPFIPPQGSISIVNDFGPGATFTGAVSPGLNCEGQGEGKAACDQSLQDLPQGGISPGRSAVFTYGYDVSGVTDTTRRNCVRINWRDGQSDPNPANDEFCAPIRICDAQQGGCPTDLVAAGGRGSRCFRGRTCGVGWPFLYNAGSSAFVGSFTANISIVPGLTPVDPRLRLSTGQPLGQCTVAAAGIKCSSGQVTLVNPNLGPPGQRVFGWATYAIPADFPRERTQICLELTEVNGDDAIKENNRACTSMYVRDLPQTAGTGTQQGGDLAVAKRLLGSCAKPGDLCRYRIRVSNEGTEPIEGQITIDDALSPASGKFVGTSAAPSWAGKAQGAGKAQLVRTGSPLGPGRSEAVDVTFRMNPDASGDVENCAAAQKIAGDANTANDKACVTVTLGGDTTEPPPPPPPVGQLDLSLQISGDNACSTGQTCRAQITLANAGSQPFDGPLSVAHSVTGGRSARVRYSGGGSGFACAGPNFDRMQCSNTSLTLAPGATVTYPANFSPTRAANGTYQNCAQIQWTKGGSNSDMVMAQSKLIQLGYNVGTADGKAGPKTRSAFRAYQRDNGLPQTGQLDQATSAALLGPVKSFNDVNRGNDRACLATTIRTTCTGGSSWDGARCVCPRGQSFIRGNCRKTPTACTADKILVNGRCVCPRGMTLQNGICQPPPQKACPYPGQIKLRSGRCVCPRGQSVIRGQCRTTPTACTADKILVNGKCVCPRGMTLQNGLCQPPPQKACTYKGQTRGRDGKCRCPSGQQVIRGVCKTPARACTADKVLVNGECVCPKGMTLQNGLCQPPKSGGSGSGSRIPPEIREQIPCPDRLRKLGVC